MIIQRETCKRADAAHARKPPARVQSMLACTLKYVSTSLGMIKPSGGAANEGASNRPPNRPLSR